MNKRICKHCNEQFDIENMPKGWMANHVRWCDCNPMQSVYQKKLIKARSARTQFKNQYSYGAVCSTETREKFRKNGLNRRHSDESKEKIRKAALASPHRRLKKGTVIYKNILLDSSWELALAKRLDELNIKWQRPSPIKWEDEQGTEHNYFPDFYLIDYDVYLDPKNPHALRVQADKMIALHIRYPNIVILKTLKECETFNIL